MGRSKKKATDTMTERDRQFAEAYLLTNCNGVEAARMVGHQGSDDALAVAASRHLKKSGVQGILAERRQELAMDALEVVQRLSDQARASLDDCLDEDGRFDIAKARRMRRMHLLSELTSKTTTSKDGDTFVEVKVKMHSSQTALITLAKYHGLLTEILAVRDLPKTDAELLKLLKSELERVTGKPVDLSTWTAAEVVH